MNKNIKALMAAVVALGMTACAYDPYKTDIPAVEYNLELTSSVEAFELTEENVNNFRLTFNWTPAREVPDGYLVTYTSELDVVGNNFSSKTVISNAEEEGVYERTFTGTQLNNWITERWNLPKNTPFRLEFRVVAEISGPTFEAPEVDRVIIDGKPIPVIIFDADKMSLSGSAMSVETEIFKTLENENMYAWVGELKPGDLSIPVVLDGATQYIVPADGNGNAIMDGQAEEVAMALEPMSWKITEAGKYRVVVNMADKNVTIYSPETDLKPKFVTFRPNGAEANPETTLEVTNLFAYGAGTGWGVKDLELSQSLADPQVLVYSGSEIKSGMKFCVSRKFTVDGTDYNQNNSYCFTCPLTPDGKRQNLTIEANKVSELWGGADGETRNSYMTIPEANFIVFDLRNMTIFATKK